MTNLDNEFLSVSICDAADEPAQQARRQRASEDLSDAPRAAESVEVFAVTGTNGNDHLELFEGVMDETNAGGDIFGYGGNDVIYRDRTGDYGTYDGSFYEIDIYGGSGSDTVSYAAAPSRIVADFSGMFGGVVEMLGGYAVDRTLSVENLVATNSHDHITGSDGANLFLGLNGNDTILGLGGDDTINAGPGNDVVDGGDGDDEIFGDTGQDTIEGGDDDDLIDGGSNSDVLDGQQGDDTVLGGNGHDDIDGGSGDDSLVGGNGTDTISGGADHDTLDGGGGSDDLYGGSGNDLIRTGEGHDEAYGHSGNDRFYVEGFGDNDINGGSGVDLYVADQDGAVQVDLYAGTAHRAGNVDSLTSIENVRTGSGFDQIDGNGAANNLNAAGGNDTVSGEGGNDTIYGGSGHDEAHGGLDDDYVYGQSGNDNLFGQNGDDRLYGSSGDDTMRGGRGDDTMNGGSGEDVVVYESQDLQGGGYDEIFGFDLGEDTFHFGEGFFAPNAEGDVVLSEVLAAWTFGMPAGDVALVANTADYGWIALGTLHDVDATELVQRIANGTILDTGSAGFEVGGDLVFEVDQPPYFEVPDFDIVL